LSYRHRFDELLEVARFVRAYLAWQNGRPKVPLIKTYIRLAMHLVGTERRQSTGGPLYRPRWYLTKDKRGTDQRLRAAGIDPQTWEIIDERAAAWAWHQLRTTKYFSVKKQVMLMSGVRGDPPPLDEELIFASGWERRKAGIVPAKELKALPDPAVVHYVRAEVRELRDRYDAS